MDRLPTSVSRTGTILDDLFTNDNEGFENIEAFTKDKANQFAAARTGSADTGIKITTAIPDECPQEAEHAMSALDSFSHDLGVALAYEQFVQD